MGSLATDPHARERAARVAAGRSSWRHGARALVLVIVMAVVTGGATAAVLLSGTTHSAPLAGAFPGSQHSLSSTSYRIGFTPDITGGVVGWCDQIRLTTTPRTTKHGSFQPTYGGGASGCGSGPAVRVTSPSNSCVHSAVEHANPFVVVPEADVGRHARGYARR